MFKDDKGQLSLEFLLIFSISLIILILFTIPFSNIAIETVTDISDSINIKSEMIELKNSINSVYSEGQSSKRTLFIDVNKETELIIKDGVIYCNLNLNNNKTKNIEVSILDYDLNSTLKLNKGENKIIISWLEGGESISIIKV